MLKNTVATGMFATERLADPELPDPDVVIRTSGEQRISNFLLYQSARAAIVQTALSARIEGVRRGAPANRPVRVRGAQGPFRIGGVTGVSHGDELSRYALSVSEGPVTSGDEIADHQVIIRGGQVEAVVVPLEEYRALKALEQSR